jgi:tRNA A-37 threonylcarbamoyl transferase component Bud32/HAMP domain-containing protein
MAQSNGPVPAADGKPTKDGSEMHEAMMEDADRTRIVAAFGDSLPKGVSAEEVPEGTQPGFQQVGRYQILERIGRGAMATVYKAYDPEIDRTLALKFLQPDLCVDEEHRSRFLREAKAAGGLSHPNIVTVFDVGEIQGRPYIAMELLDGTPLSEIMRPGAGMPIRDVVEIGIQLARALDYAHSKGIFHRDIKPSNIMRLKDGNTIKVTDFGIARIDGGEDTQHTRVGTVLGTPQYMSPEQAMGEKVDGRSDLFSVGVVLYQLLAGQAPFEATSIVTLAHRIAKVDPTPIEKQRRDTPPALRRVIERCLKKQPDKRFQNGRELATALARFIREINDEADSQGRPRIVPLRVKWTIMMAVVVAATMALTATIVIQRQYAAMMGQMIDYGASLAKFLAAENAVPALAGEWVAIDVSVQEMLRTQDFHAVTIVDRRGVVQVSNEPAVVGQPYRVPPGAKPIASRANGVSVQSYAAPDGQTVLDFEAPITFQGKEIGRVHLGILERPLSKVARLSSFMMTLLVLTTVAAVVIATYLIADRYSKPIRLLTESMAEIGKGRYDYRIAEQRKDEFGELYRAFDSMANAVQKHTEPPGSDPSP